MPALGARNAWTQFLGGETDKSTIAKTFLIATSGRVTDDLHTGLHDLLLQNHKINGTENRVIWKVTGESLQSFHSGRAWSTNDVQTVLPRISVRARL